MSFSSLLSDHEQKAFSAFLGQLAQEERYKAHNLPATDPALSQHHLQHPLQHNPQHRQEQPQLPLSSSSSAISSGDFARPLPSIMDSPTGAAQHQREWMQQISSNPLLAPGGIIDPHAMSQAFLQNPELMAQANAITQAMVLAQQQQVQFQLQQQQQQMRDQQNALLGSHAQSMQHHYHQNSPPGQYSPEQQQYYYTRDTREPSSASGDPSVQLHTSHPMTLTKRNSQSNLPDSEGHDLTPPPVLSNGNIQHSAPGSYSPSSNGYYEIGHAVHLQRHSPENDDEYGRPTKKTMGRKGSSANDSRDGYDPQRNYTRRKTSGSTPYDANGRKGDYYTENRDDSEESSFPGPVPEHRNGLGNSFSAGKMDEGDISRHRQSSSGESNASRTRSPPSNQAQPRSSKKVAHELLTEAEKKANHIASEQKRRQNIRVGFDSLVEIVPTLSECHRSEALILQKSVDYIHRLLGQKNELKSRVRDLQANLGDATEGDDSASDMEVELYH